MATEIDGGLIGRMSVRSGRPDTPLAKSAAVNQYASLSVNQSAPRRENTDRKMRETPTAIAQPLRLSLSDTARARRTDVREHAEGPGSKQTRAYKDTHRRTRVCVTHTRTHMHNDARTHTHTHHK